MAIRPDGARGAGVRGAWRDGAGGVLGRGNGCGWRAVGRFARQKLGKLARLPKGGHVRQAAEQARQGGEDEGVQLRHQPGLGGTAGGLRARAGSDAGEGLGQGMGRNF